MSRTAAEQEGGLPGIACNVGRPSSNLLDQFHRLMMPSTPCFMFRCPVKTCSLDPIPTDILLESVDAVLPLIWAMCNASLREGNLPAWEKEAIITPVPKKSNLDLDKPRNYRPISNLSFIDKLIERIVSEQVRAFLIDSDLMPPLQSAYRPVHSTETALVKVISDIIDAADEKKSDTVRFTRQKCRLRHCGLLDTSS